MSERPELKPDHKAVLMRWVQEWTLEARTIQDSDPAPLLHRRQQLREWVAAAVAGVEAIATIEAMANPPNPRQPLACPKCGGVSDPGHEYVCQDNLARKFVYHGNQPLSEAGGSTRSEAQK